MRQCTVTAWLCLASLASGQYSYREDRASSFLSLGQNPCVSKQSCSECMQTPTCAWCMQPDYLSADGSPLPRCNQEEFFLPGRNSKGKCEERFVVNPNNVFTILENVELRKSSSWEEAVQVKPQHVQLSMRVNEAYNMDFYYEQAVDYPVDLYYLMDLSKSMEDDKEKLSALGDLLAETMQEITSNFRLGFGSFVDKTVMPYVSTVPQKLLEPCDGCAAPYGYKHHMTLDTKTSDFAREVKRAQVSGNLDAPEGGFDAIMQAVVCKAEIGWRDKARKLLVLSTDAGFHYAGDGKLGGIVTPNDGKCHMEDNVYTHSTLLDYPSVSQINKVVKENSVNLIFAVTDDELHIYEQLSAAVEGSSVGRLSNDSSNVVQLVVAQYEAITSVLEMKDNATGNVKVTYFSSCTEPGGPLRQTNKCSGLKVGSKVSFTAKIEVLKCPKDPREWRQQFQISPVGINEAVLVELEMICSCDCEAAGNPGYEEKSAQCAEVGTYKCGVCECPDDYFGRNCECSAANLSFQVIYLIFNDSPLKYSRLAVISNTPGRVGGRMPVRQHDADPLQQPRRLHLRQVRVSAQGQPRGGGQVSCDWWMRRQY